MYDGLTARYTFACPRRGEARVSLSSFRHVERLPGPAHPAVFRVTFDCGCGDEHLGLVSHDDLDWAPLGLGEGVFHNLMTDRLDTLADELADLAARRIQSGEWPWTFFCYREDRPRPIFPSFFSLLAPGEAALGLVARCPGCETTSVNLVSAAHVDVPFHHDREVGVVPHVFSDDAARLVDEFRDALYSGTFDTRRLSLS